MPPFLANDFKVQAQVPCNSHRRISANCISLAFHPREGENHDRIKTSIPACLLNRDHGTRSGELVGLRVRPVVVTPAPCKEAALDRLRPGSSGGG